MLKLPSLVFFSILSLLGPVMISFPVLAQSTERVSVTSGETQVYRESGAPDINADGSFVVFDSLARLTHDTNQAVDVFRRNLNLGLTRRVSLNSSEQESICDSASPSISQGGRFVAFHSCGNNLVSGDTNDRSDIFVRDIRNGVTERVSVSSTGVQANDEAVSADISGNGRYVVFESLASNLVAGDTNGFGDIFVHDRTTRVTERASVSSTGNQADGTSYRGSISADGRYIAFVSTASTLVPGDTNFWPDIFVHDRSSGVTERVSVSSTGAQAFLHSDYASISADGRYVAFTSNAGNLVNGDTNENPDTFVHDRLTGITERVSVSSTGEQANFYSAEEPSISADGRYVAFSSNASNLVSGDTNGNLDIFVHDRGTGATERISVSSSGAQANNASISPAISDDARHIAFESVASNLVPGDTNNVRDAFVRYLGP